MIKSEYFFWLVGAVFLVMAAQMAMDRTNPKRFGSAAFWGLLGAAFFYSTGVVDESLPAEPLGVVVLVLIVLGGFGLTGKGESHTPPREKRAASAARFGNKLFLPALTIPVVAMICATLVKNWKIGGEPVLEPGYETILGLGVGAVAALAVGMVLLRERRVSVPLHSGRNMLESMGWALLLPSCSPSSARSSRPPVSVTRSAGSPRRCCRTVSGSWRWPSTAAGWRCSPSSWATPSPRSR